LEKFMTTTTYPSKQQVRDLMAQHRAAGTPPLSPEQFREQLGWKLLPNNGVVAK
jgi:hypothetical protein